MTKIYYTENTPEALKKAKEITKKFSLNGSYLINGFDWLTYTECGGQETYIFVPLNSPGSSYIRLNFDDFFAVVSASLVEDTPIIATEKTQSGVIWDEVYTKTDKLIAQYLGRSGNSKYLQLSICGVMSKDEGKGKEVSHGEFLVYYEKFLRNQEKTLDFKIYGFYPILRRDGISIGCKTFSRELIEEITAAVNNPIYKHKDELFCTKYSEEFFNYLKTLNQTRVLDSHLATNKIFLNVNYWGRTNKNYVEYKEISHSSFLEKFNEPRTKQEIEIAIDEISVLISADGIYCDGYKVSFEDFAKLEAAYKETFPNS